MAVMIVALEQATDEGRFGGKAAGLARALGAGLPVPPGVALAADVTPDRDALAAIIASLGGVVAVRSSAIGEDGDAASFAGQHATVLGVTDAVSAADAIAHVHASASASSALAYRARMGQGGAPQVAVVIQALIDADVAGVLFTAHPITGADERVIEAAWGLGEAVVQGLVTPDQWRVARGGRILEARAGEKDVRVTRAGTLDVAPADVHRICLDDAGVRAIEALATRCEAVYAGPRDLEWAFAAGALWLLQCRAVTTRTATPP